MPRLPVVSGSDFARAVCQLGYKLDHTTGSHMILLNPSGHRLSVPGHKELDRGLLRKLIADVGISRDAFIDLLKRR